MKIRTDFVTNSSSSSFIIVSKVNKCEALMNYMADEYGKYGIKLLETNLVKGVTKKEYGETLLGGNYIPDYVAEELDPEEYYLVARFISYTSEGDANGEDAWLHDHIPDEYKNEIYESEPD